ncbi:MAG: hypothetical protein ACFFBP_06620 [Promethearchaeota archaeon]
MSNRSSASSALIIITMIIGMGGLGLGTYSVFLQPPIPGLPGAPGEDGEDGVPGGGGIVVGILDPDQGDTVSGTVEIRALVAGSSQYTISILRNGSLIGATLPFQWNTGSVANGWWNITVIATDVASGNTTQDEIIVNVLNDPDKYYCSSQSEINSALTDIGTGDGTIIITEDIILTSQITVDGGGNYVIQGVSQDITVDCGGNNMAFYIYGTISSCILKDLTIDASDLTGITYAIQVSISSVRVENVRILGDSDSFGTAIYITQPDVWVSNCYISKMYYGVYVTTSAHSVYIIDNTIVDCDTGSGGQGIHIDSGCQVVCEGNYIATCYRGIYFNGEYCTIANNMLYQNTIAGIVIRGYNSTISGNTIRGVTSSSSLIYGIIVELSAADYNFILGNMITYHQSSSTGYGLRIASSSCDGNVVDGNTMLSNDDDYSNLSGSTVEGNNNYVT